MRILVQRVSHASVTVGGELKSKIGCGLLVLVGIEEADGEADIDYLSGKIVNLRVFDDDRGVMNRSLIDIGGELLIVSQFTLYAQTAKGNRPSYIRAAKPDVSVPLYERFCAEASRKLGRRAQTGVFGADMQVELLNDGPVTIWMDSKAR